MRKVKLRIEQTVRCDREVIVSVPEHALDKIEHLLDVAEGEAEFAEDVVYFLKEKGCEIVEDYDNCFNNSEVEIYDYCVLEES